MKIIKQLTVSTQGCQVVPPEKPACLTLYSSETFFLFLLAFILELAPQIAVTLPMLIFLITLKVIEKSEAISDVEQSSMCVRMFVLCSYRSESYPINICCKDSSPSVVLHN